MTECSFWNWSSDRHFLRGLPGKSASNELWKMASFQVRSKRSIHLNHGIILHGIMASFLYLIYQTTRVIRSRIFGTLLDHPTFSAWSTSAPAALIFATSWAISPIPGTHSALALSTDCFFNLRTMEHQKIKERIRYSTRNMEMNLGFFHWVMFLAETMDSLLFQEAKLSQSQRNITLWRGSVPFWKDTMSFKKEAEKKFLTAPTLNSLKQNQVALNIDFSNLGAIMNHQYQVLPYMEWYCPFYHVEYVQQKLSHL